ncbi:MAG: alpha/beta hydrolase [Polyangiaceae bacterium]|nr:alpha/beta hydrolase [Polyangiaceae bacterium]
MDRAAATARLARWLGPWAGAERAPGAVTRSTHRLREGRTPGQHATSPPGDGPSVLDVHVYERERGARLGEWVVVPGLHFLGPDDPRLDRFCRILAHAGFRVTAPALPAFLDLLVDRSLPDDLEQAVRWATARSRPGERPSLFSISFGSWPALEVAARLGAGVDGVVTFGGYAEFRSVVRFCCDGVMRAPSGDLRLARDPLNCPALFLNLQRWLDAPTPEVEQAAHGWRRMIYRTWGRMELKAPGRLEPFVREEEHALPPPARALFRLGCGLGPETTAAVEAALERAGAALSVFDPGPALARLACPVVICHGRDDDVIPWGEAPKLRQALSARGRARVLLTGMYGHTGSALPTPGALAREAWTLLAMARALASAGQLERVVGPARA